MSFRQSELILNHDGSLYHLHLLPHEVAHDIITVGDPDRVGLVANHLDDISLDKQNREFRTITGTRAGKRWTIISTGIGTDNIDIVWNELDALVNIDLESRQAMPDHTTLRFHRLGTSGTLRSDIEVDSFVASKYAVGLGGLLAYYEAGQAAFDHPLAAAALSTLADQGIRIPPYAVNGSSDLLANLDGDFVQGITYTAPGFYGPQGRSLLAGAASSNYLDHLAAIAYDGTPSTNLEMETAGIYGLSHLLGHQAISLSVILANRATGAFSQRPAEATAQLIEKFFDLFS